MVARVQEEARVDLVALGGQQVDGPADRVEPRRVVRQAAEFAVAQRRPLALRRRDALVRRPWPQKKTTRTRPPRLTVTKRPTMRQP